MKAKRVLGDGAYDTHDNFKFLAACGIETRIEVREDSGPNCGGAPEEAVRAYLQDPPGRKERVGYGRRWMAESFFSGFKRPFREVVAPKRFERIVREIRLKVRVYNLMLSVTAVPAPALCAAKA